MYLQYFASMQQPFSCKKNIRSFAAKLQSLNTLSLPISDYSKRYLDHLLSHKIYYLSIYAHVLDNVLKYSKKTISEISIVDYGAGNGLMGMFAKHCGFKKVFTCDVEEDFITAAKVTATALGVLPDDYISGDISRVGVQLNGVSIDAVAGTDVIEHVYNLDDFFSRIAAMNPDMVTVFTTASNPANFLKTRELRKLQVQDEHKGGDPGDFALANARKHEAFIVMREKIIRKNFPHFQEKSYLPLAEATRGLNEVDIIEAVTKFSQTQEMPRPDIYSTNTCNPFTGSWTERILTIDQYKRIYQSNGFFLVTSNGFYNDYTPGFKKMINRVLNVLITLTGKNTAPFITLIGFRIR